jgi:hypothetical protein
LQRKTGTFRTQNNWYRFSMVFFFTEECGFFNVSNPCFWAEIYCLYIYKKRVKKAQKSKGNEQKARELSFYFTRDGMVHP